MNDRIGGIRELTTDAFAPETEIFSPNFAGLFIFIPN